jgi:hypothetical protein
MMRAKCRSVLLIISLSFFLSVHPAKGMDDERESLKGLSAIYVVVEPIEREIERQGLTREKIRTDTIQRLRKAGIRILSKKEWLKNRAGPYLYVNLNIQKDPYGVYFHAFRVELVQKVVLIRDPKLEVFATTWSRQLLGSRGYLSQVRYAIQDAVDLFLRDHGLANPK